MHGVDDSPFPGSFIIKVLLLIRFLIYLKASFDQAFLAFAGNMVTSENFMGSGMKCDTSNPDYPKLCNELFNYFTASLKTLFKTSPSS